MGAAFGGGVKTSVRQAVINIAGSISFLLISIALVGFKPAQLILITVFNLMFFVSEATRKFIMGFSIFIVFWILFDYMKAFPNYNYQSVHISDLYNFEKHFFGIKLNGSLLTPNEYWRINSYAFLDVAGGIFYLCWVPVPLAFAAYLFFKNKEQFLYFSLTFLLVNLIGFAIYYLYPAAPPWYVQYHGFIFYADTPGNTAGLVKFDNFFHAGIFRSIYAKSSNVFAAMPSLHSSYPVIVLYYGLKNRLGLINIFFAAVMLGIWFTAVYADHHYVVDVLAGIVCAVTGIVFFHILAKNVKFFRVFLKRYQTAIQ